MPYIPKKHEKYNLLPRRMECGGEVFEYPSLLYELEDILEKSLMPYGYDSYEEQFKELDNITEAASDPEQLKLISDYKELIIKMNQKECWSVCKYVGDPFDRVFGLTPGQNYYWPTTVDDPVYRGVIDDEEFTSYWYSTEPADWEILDDPTGMAFRTIYGKDNYVSKQEYESVMEQLKTAKIEGDNDD